jgi:phosphoribosylformylglycinamidine (FGAM) synthase PurS component
VQKTFYIHARDAAGCVTLRRDTGEAAVKKAEELKQQGYFEIEITEEHESKAAQSVAQMR